MIHLHGMNDSTLADHCMNEMNKYRHGEPSDDQYGLELLRRAIRQRDARAWEVVQQRFHETVLYWMHTHPMREVACRLDSEENYVAQAFARFWQAAVGNQDIEFKTQAAALRYVRASLNGIILDTLRAYSRSRVVPLPEPGEPGEPLVEDQYHAFELWEVIQHLIPDERQKRVAYLLLHCGLKRKEITQFWPQECRDIQEIYRLRRTIIERMLRNMEYVRWRLGHEL